MFTKYITEDLIERKDDVWVINWKASKGHGRQKDVQVVVGQKEGSSEGVQVSLWFKRGAAGQRLATGFQVSARQRSLVLLGDKKLGNYDSRDPRGGGLE